MRRLFLLTLGVMACFAAVATADATRTSYLRPQYLPPAELARVLGARTTEGRQMVEWRGTDGAHFVELRRNDAANLMIVSGSADDVAALEALVKAVDVPPRQISIEARIVEVDESRARELGIDWSRFGLTGEASADWYRDHSHQRVESSYPGSPSYTNDQEATRTRLRRSPQHPRLAVHRPAPAHGKGRGHLSRRPAHPDAQ